MHLLLVFGGDNRRQHILQRIVDRLFSARFIEQGYGEILPGFESNT